MNKIYIPENYKPVLDAYDTQRAIAYIKETFQQEFSKALNLKRVSAPLFVTESSGLNDNLNGYERPVSFDIPDVHAEAQVVHSLAKWKRPLISLPWAWTLRWCILWQNGSALPSSATISPLEMACTPT